MPNICTNPKCRMAIAKAPQPGRSQCLSCKSPTSESGPPVHLATTSAPVPDLTALADDDWIDAARWAVACDLADQRAEMKTRDRTKSEACVRRFSREVMNAGEPQYDDVKRMAGFARSKAEGLKLVQGWADFVVQNLQNMGLSPALNGEAKSEWGKLSATIRNKIALIGAQDDIYTGQSTAGGGSMICIHYNLLDDAEPLRFALAHETGHVADIALRGTGSVELQKVLLQSDSYAPKPTGDHQLEYFADSFAALLLLAAGVGKSLLDDAAGKLFSGGTVTSEHPSGSDRLNNIASIASRHFAA